MANLRLRAVKLAELPAFVAEVDERLTRGESIAPVSRTRARAWMKNPHATSDDIVLLCAMLGDHYAGYLGLMPAPFRLDGETRRMSWLSTFFVPEEQRSSGAGGLLLMRALGLGLTLGVSAPSEEAARTFKAVGFGELAPSWVLGFDLPRVNPLALPLRAARRITRGAGLEPASFERAILGVGRPAREALYRHFARAIRRSGPESHSERAFALEAGQTLSERARGLDGFVRDAAVVNWMLAHPWVAVERDEDTPRYHFDDFRERHEFHLVRIFDRPGGSDLGFLVMRLAEHRGARALEVLDYRVEGPEAGPRLAIAALEQARRFSADRVTLPDACGNWLRNDRLTSALFAPATRTFLLRPGPRERARAATLLSLRPRFEDGDTAFA